MIFHLAATTRFDETLRVATNVNVRGTREMLTLAKGCKRLKLFNHVSTAYTHATKDRVNGEVSEVFYKSPIAADALIRMVETVSDDRLNAITEKLIENWPNTYSFTKAVAEDLIDNVGYDLPICITRPSIVQSSYYEPTPGWLDVSCIYGATGIIFGVGLGLLHVLYYNSNARLSYVPGDYTTNCTIAVGWHTAMRWEAGQKDIQIYTISSTKCKFSVESISRVMNGKEISKMYTPLSIWYCFMLGPQTKFMFLILTWLLHFIPAYILDFIFYIFGIQKPKGMKSLVAVYQKIYKLNLSLSYFMTNDWSLQDDNTVNLSKSLDPADKAIFQFDMNTIDWDEYVITLCMGLRKYILKDGLTNSDYGYKKQKCFQIAHYIFVTLYFYAFYKLLHLIYWFICNILKY